MGDRHDAAGVCKSNSVDVGQVVGRETPSSTWPSHTAPSPGFRRQASRRVLASQRGRMVSMHAYIYVLWGGMGL